MRGLSATVFIDHGMILRVTIHSSKPSRGRRVLRMRACRCVGYTRNSPASGCRRRDHADTQGYPHAPVCISRHRGRGADVGRRAPAACPVELSGQADPPDRAVRAGRRRRTLMSRMLAQALTPHYGPAGRSSTTVAGSGGHVGAEAAARQGAATVTPSCSAPSASTPPTRIYSKLTYDPAQRPAAGRYSSPTNAVHPGRASVGADAQREGVYRARESAVRGDSTYGTAGSGSSTHMVGELVQDRSPASTSRTFRIRAARRRCRISIGGQIQLMFENLPTAIAHVRRRARCARSA